MYAQIFLKRGKEESLLRRHPWIFSGAIEYIRSDRDRITEGEIVDVFTKGGDFIARGHYQIGSIAVRVLAFEQQQIDAAWWRERIASAYDVRRSLGITDDPQTTCYRLVHGEGDSLPGLVIDIYGSTAVVQCHSVGMFRSRREIADAVRSVYGDRFDMIILDPPAFAKHHKVLGNAMQGYKKLNARALSRIKSGGILFTFSCSQAVSKELFRTTVFSAAAIAGRRVRILHQLTQPADHPINIYHPEGEYLKGLVLYVE